VPSISQMQQICKEFTVFDFIPKRYFIFLINE